MIDQKSLIIERELAATIDRGTRISVRVRDSFATGYLIGLDSHDILIAVTEDGEKQMDPPLLLVVNRRACLVVQLHTDVAYEDEPEHVQRFLDAERDTFARHYIPEQRKAL